MAHSFQEWFAERFGVEYDGAERVDGNCGGCGADRSVITASPQPVGDGTCDPCLGQMFGWDTDSRQPMVEAVAGLIDGLYREGGGVPVDPELKPAAIVRDGVALAERRWRDELVAAGAAA